MTYSASTLTGKTVEELREQVTEELWRIAEESSRLQTSINRLTDGALQTFVASMYASMGIDSPVADTIGPIWQPIDAYTIELVAPLGFTTDINTGQFSILYEGTYSLSFNGLFELIESQQSRTYYTRLWNVTDGAVVGHEVLQSVSRNQPVASFSITGGLTLSAGLVGKQLIWQIGNNDDLGAVTWQALNFSIHSIGPWQGGDLRQA